MSFIIWLSADIVQLGDNGRNAPYVGLRRAESYLLPEGKCVRHVHICQPTFLSPQFFHLSTILTWGEELLRCSRRDRTASDKLIKIYRAPTYTAHPFGVSARGVKTVSGDTLSCTHVTNYREGGWTKLSCQSCATAWRSGIPGESCPLTSSFISRAVAQLAQKTLEVCDAARLFWLLMPWEW